MNRWASFATGATVLGTMMMSTASAAQTSGTSAWSRAGVEDGGFYEPSPNYNDNGSRSLGSATSVAAQSTFTGGAVVASASAYANLASGKMGVFGTSNAAAYLNLSSATRAEAEILDRLVFSVSGATAGQVTPITVIFGLDGTFDGRPGYGVGRISANLTMNTSGVLIYENVGSAGQTGFQTPASGWQSYSLTNTSNGIVFTGIFNLVGASTIVDVDAKLRASTYGESTVDFSHTSLIGFELPSNVSFSSASNAFLTQGSAVPESTTWAMMILGFGVMGHAMRRRAKVRTNVNYA